LLIDDPYKSRADAHSDVRREAIWNWYRNDLMSRLKPEGRIILVMTRFHTDDLIGRLLDTESDAWHVVKFTAICDDPENDPLGREYGELLWPEYQTAAFYEEKRRIGGEYDWACNYMQTPVPDQGSLFNTRYLLANKLTIPPDDIVQTVRAWDLAARIEGDWTCGLKLGRRQDGRFVILDVIRFRADPSKVEQTIKEVAAYDTPNTKIALSQDPGQAGTSQIQYLTRQLAGYTVLAERETGSKLVRATPVASQVNSGNVAMVEGGWNRAFLDEMANYPSSRWDDQVDALSRAFSVVAAPKTVSRYMQFDFMAR
jgi:predicted phage terminase large subunit-like protein